MRPTEMFPREFIETLLLLHKASPRPLWIETDKNDSKTSFICHVAPEVHNHPLFWGLIRQARDRAATMCLASWLHEGPKTFVPTVQQCQAMEQVEVRLSPPDYTQPYPTMCTVLPREMYKPYRFVLSHRADNGITVLHVGFKECYEPSSPGGAITLIIRPDASQFMEEDISLYGDDCTQEEASLAKRIYRISINLNLALVNYGNHLSYLFPYEVAGDRSLAREKSERGERARKRIPLAVQKVEFAQEIKLHHEVTRHSSPGASLASMPCHWRKGHWMMVACGKGRLDRRRVFRKATLVRGDLFTGSRSNTSTTYRG